MRALIALAFALAIALPASAVAQTKQPNHLAEGPVVLPPAGWKQFCKDNPEDVDCDTTPRVRTPAKPVVLTARLRQELARINTLVNAMFHPIDDIDHWGTSDERYVYRDANGSVRGVDKWSYPDDGKADCEDYALLKRKLLIQAGWSRDHLLITMVRDTANKSHAVLTAVTTAGDLSLDSLRPDIVLWNKNGYRYLGRQSSWSPNVWVKLVKPEETLARAN